MKFCWTTLYVSNMEKSLAFYHDLLGLKIAERFSPGDETEIVMLGEENEAKIELIEDKKVVHKSLGISIGFEVDSIEDALKLMRDNNIPIKRGPISPMPTLTFFFVADPDGLEVQLVCHKK